MKTVLLEKVLFWGQQLGKRSSKNVDFFFFPSDKGPIERKKNKKKKLKKITTDRPSQFFSQKGNKSFFFYFVMPNSQFSTVMTVVAEQNRQPDIN